jgi:hypothetical protein
MLGPDVVVTQPQRLAQNELEDALGRLCPGWRDRGRAPSLAERRQESRAENLWGWLEAPQRLAGDTSVLLGEGHEEVLRQDLVVAVSPRQLRREGDGVAGAVSKPFQHDRSCFSDADRFSGLIVPWLERA